MKYRAAGPVSLLDLSHQLVGGELAPHHQDEVLDDVLRAVYIQESTNHYWKTTRVHLYEDGILTYDTYNAGLYQLKATMLGNHHK